VNDPQHAFVDESVRRGRYRLTAVWVPVRSIDSTRRSVLSVVPRGQRRPHLSAENAQRRKSILAAYCQLGLAVTVVRAPYRLGDDDQPARDLCLRHLVSLLGDQRTSTLWIDTRGDDRDAADRSTLAPVVAALGRGAVRYAHIGSREEPLLGLPDAFGWADGAAAPFPTIVAAHISVAVVGEGG
jgi:hypothetical protein